MNQVKERTADIFEMFSEEEMNSCRHDVVVLHLNPCVVFG